MRSGENFPDPNMDLPTELGIFGLIWNIRELATLATKLNSSHLDSYHESDRQTSLRYVLQEAANHYVPLTTKRIILSPEKDKDEAQFSVSRVILRIPADDKVLRRVQHPNDIFIETVSETGQRERHLLNGTGLWLFIDGSGLTYDANAEETNNLFTPTEQMIDMKHRIRFISRIISDYLPVLQSSGSTERS